MNYLAHIFLNGNNPEHQIGGFIGDFVKGDFKGQYTDAIEMGIHRHRQIDKLSDYLTTFIRSRKRIKPELSRFSGIFVDIYYDHFLSKHWDQFHSESLSSFSRNFMHNLEAYLDLIPIQAKPFIQYMKMNELFDYYSTVENIDRVFQGMSRRMKRENPIYRGSEDLIAHYDHLEKDFFEFMEEINRALDSI